MNKARTMGTATVGTNGTLVLCGSGFLGLDDDVVEEDGAVYVFRLTVGALGEPVFTLVDKVAQGGTFPMWICVHPSKIFAYVVDGGYGGRVHSYSIAATGKLSVLAPPVSSGGQVPCHGCVVAAKGGLPGFLLVTNFVGGSVAVLPIGPDGSLSDAVDVKQHGKGANEHPRQTTAHPHWVGMDETGTHALVCDLGLNAVVVYVLDRSTGTLTERSRCVLHSKAGPRHLAFSRCGRFAYVIGELDNSLTALRYNASEGRLSRIEGGSVDLIATNEGGATGAAAKGGGASEVVLDKSGKFAYCSVRTTGRFNASPPAAFNRIVVLSLDPKTGLATRVNTVSSGGNMPWSHVWASERMLLVQNQSTLHSGLPEEEGGENDGHNGIGPGQIVAFHVGPGHQLRNSGVAATVPQAVSIALVSRL